jgi:Cu/Ag efflux protein CusF
VNDVFMPVVSQNKYVQRVFLRGEPIRPLRLIAHSPEIRETAMKIAKIILAGTAALTIIGSAALAQQAPLTGIVTQVDRISRTVTVRQTQSGTVGANTGGAADEFKVQAGLSLDNLHAGDKVNFSASEAGGVKTITKFEAQ